MKNNVIYVVELLPHIQLAGYNNNLTKYSMLLSFVSLSLLGSDGHNL